MGPHYLGPTLGLWGLGFVCAEDTGTLFVEGGTMQSLVDTN